MTEHIDWNDRYRDGDLPWDTGRPSSELQRVVGRHAIRPCRALEIGCGTGTNSVWLAQQGFEVTGFDMAPLAVERAEQLARAAGVKAHFVVDQPNPKPAAVNAEPKDVQSRPLFENWKSSARRDGKIPGGRIGEMAASLRTFMDLNPGHEQSVKLEPVVEKCDASRDWTPVEAAALLDEIAAITPRAEWAMRTNTEREIHSGKPLPDELDKGLCI